MKAQVVLALITAFVQLACASSSNWENRSSTAGANPASDLEIKKRDVGAGTADSESATESGNSNPSERVATACVVDKSDIPESPTVAYVQSFVSNYMGDPRCSPRLRNAITTIFKRESRSDEWATSVEGKLKDAIEALHGSIVSGSCHSSLCRYEVELPPSGNNPPFDLDRRVIEATSGTAYQVASLHYGSAARYQIYLYSTIRPLFVEPLRVMMAGT
jgi:hypothetical protein